MKHVTWMILIGVLLTAHTLFAQNQEDKTNVDLTNSSLTQITWEKLEADLGVIEQKKPVTIAFNFTNSGDVPLVISEVKTSCGCTATNYSKEPLKPGESSKIDVTYNASALGKFTKSITVKSNIAEGSTVLTIKGETK